MHPTSDTTDEELVVRTLHNKEFFGALVERYEGKLTRYVRRLGVKRPEDIEDVLQETFLKAYRSLNGFDTSLSFSSWIYRIAHNEAVTWFRRHDVRPEGHLHVDGEEIITLIKDEEENSESNFDQSLNSARLAEALNQIDEKYRDVLILRYFEHKEYEEISDILKIPIGSVGTLIHRGKRVMRKHIDEEKIRV